MEDRYAHSDLTGKIIGCEECRCSWRRFHSCRTIKRCIL